MAKRRGSALTRLVEQRLATKGLAAAGGEAAVVARLHAAVLDEARRTGPLHTRALYHDEQLAHEGEARAQRLQVERHGLARAAVRQPTADAAHARPVQVEAVVGQRPAAAAAASVHEVRGQQRGRQQTRARAELVLALLRPLHKSLTAFQAIKKKSLTNK